VNFSPDLVRFVSAVPATVKLVGRLLRDERVDRRERIAAGLALAYVVLPIDIIPDHVPVLGKVDDVAIVVVALTRLVDAAGADVVREHWDADAESLHTLLGLLAAAGHLVPKRLRLAASIEGR
jgi:uncharacterized membrane protein YkvA (DUF1232 family)